VIAITTKILSFVCPSSPPPVGTYYGKVWTGNSYFASVGASLHWVGDTGNSSPNGIFMYGGKAPDASGYRESSPLRTVAFVQDGISNAIAFGEWPIGHCNESKLSIQDVISVHTDPPGISGDGWGDPKMNMPTGAQNFLSWM